MIAKQIVVRGEVQGVGYRDWMMEQAERLGISGWVRNRRDGGVEALVAGDADAVEELSRLCRRGPQLAEVSSIVEELVEPPEHPGFFRAPWA